MRLVWCIFFSPLSSDRVKEPCQPLFFCALTKIPMGWLWNKAFRPQKRRRQTKIIKQYERKFKAVGRIFDDENPTGKAGRNILDHSCSICGYKFSTWLLHF